MAYLRCDCKVGDIPHPTTAVHKRAACRRNSVHSRCTRVATMSVRRIRDTEGRTCQGPWYTYCEPCARAIRAYQGSDVELSEQVRD